MAEHRGGGRTLNRDYKDVRRHAPGAPGQPFGGWAGFGAGLGVGLAVALAVHLYDRNQASGPGRADSGSGPDHRLQRRPRTMVR